jgi:hypothetical protein
MTNLSVFENAFEYIFIVANIALLVFVSLAVYWVYRKTITNNVKEGLDIGGAFKKAGNAIKGAFQDVGNKTKEVVKKVENTVADIKFPSPDDIKNQMEKAFNDLEEKTKRGFNDIGKEVKGVAKKAQDAIMGPLLDIFDKVKKAFDQIPKRFTAFGNGFKTVFDGIGEEFKGLGDGLHDGFNNIGKLLKFSGIYVFDYVLCGVKVLQNLHACIFYYALQMIGQIFYLPIRWYLWLLYMVGLDLYSYETEFWDYVEWFDGITFTNLGFHISRFPKNIRDQCYNCRRIKQSTISRVAKDINHDFMTGIPEKLQRGIRTIERGGDEIKYAFRPGYI